MVERKRVLIQHRKGGSSVTCLEDCGLPDENSKFFPPSIDTLQDILESDRTQSGSVPVNAEI